MKKLQLSDVKNLHEYELIRDDWRRSVIAEKERRRVLLGPAMSLVFENRLTVLGQVQEMCRADRIVRPEAVQHEIDVYNELIPDAGEVAATIVDKLTRSSGNIDVYLISHEPHVTPGSSERSWQPHRSWIPLPVGDPPGCSCNRNQPFI